MARAKYYIKKQVEGEEIDELANDYYILEREI